MAPSADLESLAFPERARRSCALLQEAFEEMPARVDREACRALAAQMDVARVKELGSSLANDANATKVDQAFASVDAEAALIVLMHGLDFGGGWRLELHAHHGKGAWQTVKPGVEAIYSAQPALPTAWLSQLDPEAIASMFGLGGSEPLRPFAAQLQSVCNELGRGAADRGASTMSEFLLKSLDSPCREGEGPAAKLVRLLVEAFPLTFDDRHVFRGQTVYLYKKAQLVVGEIYHRFRSEDPRYDFSDGDELTAFIDNVICAVVRKDGAIVLSDQLAAAIDANKLLASGGEAEVSLRAAAMTAVEETAKAARELGKDLTSTELGNYYWGILGKTPEYRKFTRHATRDTVFY